MTGAPAEAEVDARGCTLIAPATVLQGISFKVNRAEIEPDSEWTLRRALAVLRDDPKAQVEIGGHSDHTGTAQRNAGWLVAHGIDTRRLTAKGYGASQPQVKNVDEPSRAFNRRIEFTRHDE